MKYFSIFAIILLITTTPIAFIDIPSYTVYEATGDSMLPTHDRCGLSVVREDVSISELDEKEDIVLVENNMGMILHRYIKSQNGSEFTSTAGQSLDDDIKYIETKGDNNALGEITIASNYKGLEVYHIDTPSIFC